MYIVKLTYNYDWPLFRQTPNFSGIWGDYQFIIDDNLKECDFWIVYSNYKFDNDVVLCNPENIIFIPAECYNTSPRFSQRFLDQFGMLVTVQRELKHRNIKYIQNANPWFVNKSYDELVDMKPINKTKLISVVSSNKAFTRGHRKRLKFVKKLKEVFGDQLDVYGRGIRSFEDKWDVLAAYKYSIAIENDYCNDWVTEKFYDCLYAFTYPIYYGCPNLGEYIDENSLTRIDLNDFEKSVNIIKACIQNDTYNKKLDLLKQQRIVALSKDNFFPMITDILSELDPFGEKRLNVVTADDYPESTALTSIIERFKSKIFGR